MPGEVVITQHADGEGHCEQEDAVADIPREPAEKQVPREQGLLMVLKHGGSRRSARWEEEIVHAASTKHTKPAKGTGKYPAFFVYLPGFVVTQNPMSAIDDLRETMVRLRTGCPWDREQTHESLTRCLIDEVSELLDTIDRRDMPHMREELGDVLIQIIFHALIAEEGGHFNLDDVAREINEKLVRRHPHVFGTGRLDTSDQVITQWEAIKAQEKKNGPAPSTAFKPMPPRLPALMFAEAVAKRIEKDQLPAAGVVDHARIQSLGTELTPEDAGRQLFELAAACRQRGFDPEMSLRLETERVMRDVETKIKSRA